MLKQFKKLMNNPKYRTSIVIGAICIFIAAVIIFIGFELNNNHALYIDNYQKEQQLLVDQVGIRMKYQMDTEQSEVTEVIDQMIGGVETSGSRFWFVANDKKLLFVKNQVTSNLFTYITLDNFIQQYQEDGMYLSYNSFSIGEEQYTIGICTKKDFIEESGQLFKHNIYIIMPLVLISAIMLVLFIVGILLINRQENKINQLNSEAIDRNITIENLTSTIKKTRLNDLGGATSQSQESHENVIYNKEVLVSLLNKINRENIVPLTIVIIELSSKNSKYATEDYHKMLRPVSNILSKDHILAEILPGVYAILMFHTVLDSNEAIKKTLVNQWALPLKKKGIKVRMGISCIEDYDANVENVFEIVYREVAVKMKTDNSIKKVS